jgi:hypothetical protein
VLLFSPENSVNHYQNIIYSSLYEAGIEVTSKSFDEVSRLAACLNNSNHKFIFHQHWLNNIYSSPISDLSRYDSIDNYFGNIRLFRTLGGKVIWTVHNLYDHDIEDSNIRLLNQYCICQMARVADLILIHSPNSQPALEKICGFDISDRVHVLPHPLYDSMLSIPPERPPELDSAPDFNGFSFLCFGLLRPYKGGLQLLNHYQSLLLAGDLDNSRLIFAGIVQDKALLREYARLPNSIRKRIILINRRVSDSELIWLCIHCEVAVLPYREILTSGSFYQATTFALPAIVPDGGTFSSMVTDGDDALTYKTDSELRAALQRAFALGKLPLRHMGVRALARHQPVSASAIISAQFAQLLRQLVDSRPPSSSAVLPDSFLSLSKALLDNSANVLSTQLELSLDLSSLNVVERLCWWCWASHLLHGCGRPAVLVLFESDFDAEIISDIEHKSSALNFSICWCDSMLDTSTCTMDRVYSSSSMTLSDKLLRRFDRIHVHPDSLPSVWPADVYWKFASGYDWRVAFKSLLAHFSGENWQSQFISWIDSVSPVEFHVTALTSIFNGDAFLTGFLENAALWKSYPECEHLLIRAASPGNEHAALMRHVQQHPNAVYIDLQHDPGLYAVWNLGARLASGRLLTSANLDDRRAPEQMTTLVEYLDMHPHISVASSGIRLTTQPNLAWEDSEHCEVLFRNELTCNYGPARLFSRDERGLISCNLPHCMPVWRRSLHIQAGYFNEARFGPSADWAFWISAGLQGARYAYIASPLGLYLRHTKSYWRRSGSRNHDERIIAEFADRALRGSITTRTDFTLRQRIEETLTAMAEVDSLGLVSGLLDCALRLRHLDLVDSDDSASRKLIDLMALRWLGMRDFVRFIEQHKEILKDLSDPLNNVMDFVVELLHENILPAASPISTLQHHLEFSLLDHYLISRSIRPLLILAFLRRKQNCADAEEYLLSRILELAPQSFQAEMESVYRIETPQVSSAS